MVTESRFITERATSLAAGAVAVSVLQEIALVTPGGILRIPRNVAKKCSGYIHPNVLEGVQATKERTAEASQYRLGRQRLHTVLY